MHKDPWGRLVRKDFKGRLERLVPLGLLVRPELTDRDTHGKVYGTTLMLTMHTIRSRTTAHPTWLSHPILVSLQAPIPASGTFSHRGVLKVHKVLLSPLEQVGLSAVLARKVTPGPQGVAGAPGVAGPQGPAGPPQTVYAKGSLTGVALNGSDTVLETLTLPVGQFLLISTNVVIAFGSVPTDTSSICQLSSNGNYLGSARQTFPSTTRDSDMTTLTLMAPITVTSGPQSVSLSCRSTGFGAVLSEHRLAAVSANLILQ